MAGRRAPRRRATALPALALLVVLVAAAGLASASGLVVRTAPLSLARGSAPCAGQVTVTATSATELTLTLSDTSCVGRALQVAVVDGAAVLAQGGVVPTAATSRLTVPAFTATPTTAAVATVDGWPLPALWAPTGSVVPGTSTTVLVAGPEWYTRWDGRPCVRVSASTSTSQQTVWAVDLLVTRPPFPGTSATYRVDEGSGQVQVAAGSPAGVVRLVGLKGNEDLKAGQVRTFSVCW